jgi:hypothetical protein
VNLTVNVNDSVWVRLTVAGMETLTRSHQKLLDKIPDYPFPEPVSGEWYRFMLWELMHIFGPHLSLGAPTQFVDGEARLTSPRGAFGG